MKNRPKVSTGRAVFNVVTGKQISPVFRYRSKTYLHLTVEVRKANASGMAQLEIRRNVPVQQGRG